MKLPDAAPTPESRPKPPEAQTAKAPDRKETDQPKEKQANKPKSDEKEFNADEVAALLSKEKAAGGGAKRSTDEASLGGKKTTSGEKLYAKRDGRAAGPGRSAAGTSRPARSTRRTSSVSIKFKLDACRRAGWQPGDRRTAAAPTAIERAAAESARRAVPQCAPYNLPADKYEAWAEVHRAFRPKRNVLTVAHPTDIKRLT